MSALSEQQIIISPIGDVKADILKSLGMEIERIFGYSTKIQFLLQDVNFSLDPARDQYYSTLILEKLEKLAFGPGLKILGITHVDLFIPILTYVYGEAQLGGKACIVSTHRLGDELPSMDSEKAYWSRIIKEAVHELGHTFRLRHCPDQTCIMHYCRCIEDVDKKSDRLCRYCTVLLDDEINRLHHELIR